MKTIVLAILTIHLSLLFVPAQAENAAPLPPAAAPAMNNAGLDALIRRIDKNAKGENGYWEFKLENRVLLVVTDEKADRMRIMTPAAKTEGIDEKRLYRLMQANFDSALDARYAIAKEVVWSTFLHPLASLSPAEFLSGVGQVVNLADTYGSHYSSGLLMFRGGDSEGMRQRRELIERLLRKI